MEDQLKRDKFNKNVREREEAALQRRAQEVELKKKEKERKDAAIQQVQAQAKEEELKKEKERRDAALPRMACPWKGCRLTFASSRGLLKHSLRHESGEYVSHFECTICTKTFNQVNTLKKHNDIHSGNTPFGCYLCHRRFGDAWRLSCH